MIICWNSTISQILQRDYVAIKKAKLEGKASVVITRMNLWFRWLLYSSTSRRWAIIPLQNWITTKAVHPYQEKNRWLAITQTLEIHTKTNINTILYWKVREMLRWWAMKTIIIRWLRAWERSNWGSKRKWLGSNCTCTNSKCTTSMGFSGTIAAMTSTRNE